jgi:P27 family predicted phage terminase small subunit
VTLGTLFSPVKQAGKGSAMAADTPPAGLGDEGRKLWEAVVAAVRRGWRLDARDLHWLAQACRIEDTIVELEVVLSRDGEMTVGSKGQPVVHPAVAELRQLALAQARLLDKLELEDPAVRIIAQRERTAARTAEWRRRQMRAVS